MIENTCWLMVIMNVNSVVILKSMNVINDKCVINSLISKMLRWLFVYDGLLQIKFSMSKLTVQRVDPYVPVPM